MTKSLKRCRAQGPSSAWHARQCDKPAKTTRVVEGVEHHVCGIHARAIRVHIYQPYEKYERPVQLTIYR